MDGRDGQEDGGVQERDAADFEDVGGVGRGRGVRRQVREDGERHAADLEDGTMKTTTKTLIAERRKTLYVPRELPLGRSI